MINGVVLAVQSQGGPYPLMVKCGKQNVLQDSRDVTRAVIAGVLHAAWGVLPSYATNSAV